ncbi:16053_t:CDS:2 [Funneliformis caledonium]|uniref:16053_t:CDS:1 n=1 Tax=Funneliformis caledonium TaxID=1117310 RepID=A0A9N9A4D4_9GLOM|nr:16053_t:CDS:2 [Funneliformis caledonium]
MKHGKHHKKLGRNHSHRMAMLRNMVSSLIVHDRIKTTLPKAREARKLAEKERDLTIPKLFNEMADRYRIRQGGYTRIHKLGSREGDNAPMAVLEYVDTPGDLSYSMLIKKLARLEIDPSLKISPTIIEEGQASHMDKREYKKTLRCLQGQKKFERKVEKMKDSKSMSKDDLDKKVASEIHRLNNLGKRENELRIQSKTRRKGGHLSYESY